MTDWILTWGPRIRRGVLLAVVVVTPLLMVPNVLMDAFNVPKFAFVLAGTGVSLAVWIAEIASGAASPMAKRAAVPALLFVLPLVYGWIFTDYRSWAVFGLYGRFLGVLPYLVVGAFGWMLAQTFATDRRPLAWGVLASGAMVSLYSLIQAVGIDPFAWPLELSPLRLRRAYSTLGNPNFAGAFLAIVLPIGVATALWDRGRRDIAWTLTALVASGLLVSYSQGPWLAAAAGTALVAGVALHQRCRSAKLIGVTVAVICASLSAGVVVAAMTSDSAARRLGPTVEVRAWLWDTALRMVAERPLRGWGPNVFAVEGVRFRPAEESAISRGIGEDPHNLLLSHSVSAGLVGAAATVLLAVWILRRVRQNLGAQDVASIGFAGGAVGYLVQGLVSIDEPPIRVVAWVAIAGIMPRLDPPIGSRPHRHPRRVLVAIAAALGVALALTSVAWSYGFVRADADVRAGVRAAQDNDPQRTILNFERALAFRDDYGYRLLYGTKIGELGTRRGAAGAPYIAKMRKQFAYLDHFPQFAGYVTQARLLLAWGEKVDPAATREALTLYERAQQLDPNSPGLAAETTDALRALRREPEALALLQRFSDDDVRSPAYYGALALVHAELGNDAEARWNAAIALDLDPRDGRAKLALQELAESGT